MGRLGVPLEGSERGERGLFCQFPEVRPIHELLEEAFSEGFLRRFALPRLGARSSELNHAHGGGSKLLEHLVAAVVPNRTQILGIRGRQVARSLKQ